MFRLVELVFDHEKITRKLKFAPDVPNTKNNCPPKKQKKQSPPISLLIHLILLIRSDSYFYNQTNGLFLFLSFFCKNSTYIFYHSYVSIWKDLQKTIVLSSGPFMQVVTFIIQCICNL